MAETDALLTALARMFNTSPNFSGMSITLFVRGSIISGIMVSAESFAEGVAADMAASPAPALAGIFEVLRGSAREDREAFESFKESEAADDEEYSLEGEDWAERAGAYIHLRDARTFSGGTALPTNAGAWVRVRVDDVSAWSMGHWAPAQS